METASSQYARPCSCRFFSFSAFFFQAEDGIRDHCVTGVQTCALPISEPTDELPLRPPRISVASPARRRLLQELLDLSDGFGFGKSRFVEFHVKRFFKGAHQLDAVEG